MSRRVGMSTSWRRKRGQQRVPLSRTGLPTFIRTTYQPDARTVFTQVCSGVRYCHERLVVHRDIKLENVLVQYHDRNVSLSNPLDPRTAVVKLIDFGFASLVVPGKKLR